MCACALPPKGGTPNLKRLTSALNRTPLALALLLSACASTTIKETWKSPDYHGGPVKKVAVLAVADRPNVRPALEDRFARDMEKRGQPVFLTVDLLSLSEIKDDKAAAAARFRKEGADCVLIVQLMDQTSYNRQVRQTPDRFVPVTTGFSTYGWGTYYDVAFMNMGVTYGSMRDYLFLDTSLFELNTGKRLWAVTTKTVLTEDADRLVEADKLVAKVVAQLVKDGMIQ